MAQLLGPARGPGERLGSWFCNWLLGAGRPGVRSQLVSPADAFVSGGVRRFGAGCLKLPDPGQPEQDVVSPGELCVRIGMAKALGKAPAKALVTMQECRAHLKVA